MVVVVGVAGVLRERNEKEKLHFRESSILFGH
jgi:hypothetical protein